MEMVRIPIFFHNQLRRALFFIEIELIMMKMILEVKNKENCDYL